MGSYSSSSNTSQTSYQNLPVSQQDVSNPINLLNASNVRLGSDINQTGSTFNTLDGGAISKAFEFGTQAITKLADLSVKANAGVADASSQAVKAAVATTSGQAEAEATDWMQNPKILAAAVAVAVAYMFTKKG